MDLVPVILAGGAGTRLWPLSREERPKQFHNLSGAGTLLEETIRRLLPLEPSRVIVVTSKAHEGLTQEQLAPFPLPHLVLSEPRPRNTAAAILYAALYLAKCASDSIMICCPADHHISNTGEFIRLLREAIRQAESGKLVTIGIRPLYPETGYGYIKAVPGNGAALPIERFVEKPDLERAREYCASGLYFWNSGIFIWQTSVILDWFRRLLPAHVAAFAPLASMTPEEQASSDGKAWQIKKNAFDAVESISIDYGIMEKADNGMVIPGDFGWTDLGSWKSIDDILPPDGAGNRSPQPDKAVFLNASDCSVFSEGSRISVVGLRNVVVVEAGGDILVMDKDSAQEVRRLVEIIRR